MTFAARALIAPAAILFSSACRHAAPPPSVAAPVAPLGTTEALAPSPRLIVGRILAVDAPRGFAFVDLAPDAPPASTVVGVELSTRTMDLEETARLRASRYVRGRTLGVTIVAGKPRTGDEVVWLAP